jgi:hypothetical protein
VIRLGFALVFSLLLVVVVARWAPEQGELPQLPARADLERGARASLGELREVASTWLLPPVEETGGQVPSARDLERPVPAPPRAASQSTPAAPLEEATVEYVAAAPAAGADASEWTGASPTAAPAPEVAAEEPSEDRPALGQFASNDLDESAGIVRRLLAIYARLEESR